MDGIQVVHNSQSLKYRKPFGAVECGKRVKLSIDINKEIIVALEIVKFDGTRLNMGMKKEYLNNGSFRYSIEINTSNTLGVLQYYFILIDKYDRLYYGDNDEHLGGVGQLYEYNPVPYQITVYKKANLPNWYKEGIVYQIFVDRFFNGNDGNTIMNPKKNSFIYGRWSDLPMYIKDYQGKVIRWDFYGGNLRGIIKKLDYIKELGANIIQLSPIFKSSSCHKYDTGDYEVIDEMFGTEEEFKELCKEAKKRGMRIILDAVFSYTSSDSKYFNKLGNYNEIGAYQSPNSKYHNWYKFTSYPFYYESWWGINDRPNVNVMENTYINYIINNHNSIIEKWIALGASGWKLNVIDELPDIFIQLIRNKLNELNSDTVLIGDVWEDASNKISYSKKRKYLFGEEIQSVTNYPLREILINFTKGYIKSYKFKQKIMSLYENYPREVFYSNLNIIGTNDTERILTVLDGNLILEQLIIVMQFTLPGVPMICYGDEAGIKGGNEPDNRRSYPWGHENSEIIEFYKKITRIRNDNIALKRGDIYIYDTENNVVAYERVYDEEKIIVIVNVSDQNKIINNIELKGLYIDLFTEEKYEFIGDINTISLRKQSFKILRKLNMTSHI